MSRIGELWEREVLSGVKGRALELGFGTGASLPHYGPGLRELVAVEPATQLGAIGRERLTRFSAERGIPGTLLEASASRPLPLDAGSFDAVVILFVLCSIARLDDALCQAHRLLRPGGALVLAEHVADEGAHPGRDRAQRLIRPAWKLALGGCDPHKSLEASLERNGFDTSALERRELDLPWVVRSGLIGRAPRS